MPPFLIPFIGPLVDKLVGLIPDKAAAEKARVEAEEQLLAQQDDMIKAFLASDQAQNTVNAEEAKSTNLFIAGGRPAIIWICAAAFGWTYVGAPVLTFIAAAIGKPIVGLPVLNLSEMMPVLLGLLGLGGLRTYEKTQGVQNNH
jgi:hypothetical protein